MNKRDKGIDFLRAIALFCIVLAHVYPPVLLSQLRSFDVPLMVFLSGACFHYKKYKWGGYCVKRFVRLIIPTWIFISIYFLFRFVVYSEIPSNDTAVDYYTLQTNWYVWIIRVFFWIALVAPFSVYFDKLRSNQLKALFFFISIVLEILEMRIRGKYGVYLIELMPYFMIFILGTAIKNFTKRDIKLLAASCLFLYAVLGFYIYIKNGYWIPTQAYKYPPRMYYMAYALFIILLLWENKDVINKIQNRPIINAINFISSHSIWIYFWHILFLDLIHFESWLINYVLVLILAMIVVYIQEGILTRVVDHLNNEKLINCITLIFRG